jgi:hypothetical protein
MYFWTVLCSSRSVGSRPGSFGSSWRRPSSGVISEEVYNQMFTTHGLTMVFLVVMPLGAAFFNYMMPAADRRPRRRVPAPERVQLLGYLFGGIFLYSVVLLRRPAQRWVVRLRAAVVRGSGHGDGLLRGRPADPGCVIAGCGGQLHHHHPEHACPGHDHHAAAGVHLDVADHQLPAAVRAADHRGGAVHAAVRRDLRRPVLPARHRR